MILDSGNRRQYETGAVRDIQEGKGRCDLIPIQVISHLFDSDPILENLVRYSEEQDTLHLYSALHNFASLAFGNRETMILEVSKHFEEGANKYGENNWQKGLPQRCYLDSAIRHYLKYRRGDKDEPHNRAFVWNIMCCIWEVDYHN